MIVAAKHSLNFFIYKIKIQFYGKTIYCIDTGATSQVLELEYRMLSERLPNQNNMKIPPLLAYAQTLYVQYTEGIVYTGT